VRQKLKASAALVCTAMRAGHARQIRTIFGFLKVSFLKVSGWRHLVADTKSLQVAT
jgi:hypothetical protein